MIKTKFGPIGNYETGERKEIVVNALSKDMCRKNVLIGAGITLTGIIYLTLSAFKNGACAYEEVELKTLDSLGLIHEVETE